MFTVREYVSDSLSGGKFWRVVISDELLVIEHGKIDVISRATGFNKHRYPSAVLAQRNTTTWSEASDREAKKIKDGYVLRRTYQRSYGSHNPDPKSTSSSAKQTSSNTLFADIVSTNTWF